MGRKLSSENMEKHDFAEDCSAGSRRLVSIKRWRARKRKDSLGNQPIQ